MCNFNFFFTLYKLIEFLFNSDRFAKGNLQMLGPVQLLWKSATQFGVGMATGPSPNGTNVNVTYYVARFDQCATVSGAGANIDPKQGIYSAYFQFRSFESGSAVV